MSVTLDRVDKKNALSSAMYEAMSAALERAETDPTVRVVLLQAEGDTFSAGNDLSEFAARSTDEGHDRSTNPAERFLRNLATGSTPLVAAVQGNAVGIGLTMLLHCDLVYLADDARLTAPFVNLALVPEAASSLLLPSRVGHARAYAMFALGAPMDAPEALACGLANAVVPSGQLRARARAAAEVLAHAPQGALGATKRLMRDQERLVSRMNEESALFAQCLRTPEAKAAFAAFAKRRTPNTAEPSPSG
jgi:enoyl-CoA hydratase/carnithine racemase